MLVIGSQRNGLIAHPLRAIARSLVNRAMFKLRSLRETFQVLQQHPNAWVRHIESIVFGNAAILASKYFTYGTNQNILVLILHRYFNDIIRDINNPHLCAGQSKRGKKVGEAIFCKEIPHSCTRSLIYKGCLCSDRPVNGDCLKISTAILLFRVQEHIPRAERMMWEVNSYSTRSRIFPK